MHEHLDERPTHPRCSREHAPVVHSRMRASIIASLSPGCSARRHARRRRIASSRSRNASRTRSAGVIRRKMAICLGSGRSSSEMTRPHDLSPGPDIRQIAVGPPRIALMDAA